MNEMILDEAVWDGRRKHASEIQRISNVWIWRCHVEPVIQLLVLCYVCNNSYTYCPLWIVRSTGSLEIWVCFCLRPWLDVDCRETNQKASYFFSLWYKWMAQSFLDSTQCLLNRIPWSGVTVKVHHFQISPHGSLRTVRQCFFICTPPRAFYLTRPIKVQMAHLYTC